jgi:histidine decarboxylase
MLSRRRFFTGASGLALAAVTCQPSEQALRQLFGNARAVAGTDEPVLNDNLFAIQNQLLGYPVNMATPSKDFFDWRQELFQAGIGMFAFNNVGDPFERSHIPFNTHNFEREVIRRFAAKYGFVVDDTWGFLSNSGTDSNMHGIYIGRTILEANTGRKPKIYFTKEAHYSMQILRDVLAMDWVEVRADENGSMNTQDLAEKLDMNKEDPALVVATIGTTFKGAIDSVDEIQKALAGRESFLHLDAALFGGYLPHTPYAAELLQHPDGKNSKNRYDSLAVSCHKFFGYHSPAGLFMTTQEHFAHFKAVFSKVHDPEYLLQVPGTITCSRDAVKPAEFYYYTTEKAFGKQEQDAKQILSHAEYLYQEMKRHFAHLNPMRADARSNIVYFRKPVDRIVEKFVLATATSKHEGLEEKYAHVIVMPHVSKEVMDRFLSDLQASNGRR